MWSVLSTVVSRKGWTRQVDKNFFPIIIIIIIRAFHRVSCVVLCCELRSSKHLVGGWVAGYMEPFPVFASSSSFMSNKIKSETQSCTQPPRITQHSTTAVAEQKRKRCGWGWPRGVFTISINDWQVENCLLLSKGDAPVIHPSTTGKVEWEGENIFPI